jgi:hypothetical protein
MQAIMEGPAAHEKYVKDFLALQFPAGDVPVWAVEALATANIHVTTTLTADAQSKGPGVAEEADGGQEGAEGPAAKRAKSDLRCSNA